MQVFFRSFFKVSLCPIHIEYYGINYFKSFEPYVIVERDGLRRYDERLRGYGLNKVLHLEMLARVDSYQFFVFSRGFLVSRECGHVKSDDENSFRKDKIYLKWLEHLGRVVRDELENGKGTVRIYSD